MITETKLQEKLEALHTEVLETVIAHIKRIKALVKKAYCDGQDLGEAIDDVMLINPVMYQYIDDNNCEVICTISMGDKIAVVDTGIEDREVLLKELETNILIAIVGQLELFDTFEDIENQLI